MMKISLDQVNIIVLPICFFCLKAPWAATVTQKTAAGGREGGIAGGNNNIGATIHIG